jgi:hypothetical protein
MGIRKYKNDSFLGDDMAWFEEILPFKTTWTYKGRWYDPDKFELIPKESYKKELAEAKQKQIDELERQKQILTDELKKLKE